MCGICGIVNYNGEPVDEIKLRKMMSVMKHRGPDDEGIYSHKNVGLGFVRLSIIDLTYGGHQPMTDVSNTYTIIFNGEIYNYIEIREKLKKKGYHFRSSSDTEVLLYAYIEWGKKCLDQLNGMFSFAVFNKNDNKVFIARDRYGIKPLYYYFDKFQFIFSSEIPPILEVYNISNEANYQAVYDFLTYNRTDHLEETFFKGIRKLEHASFLEIEKSDIRKTKWYFLEERLQRPQMTSEEYLDLLNSSISFRLRSDVPVGVCLSGGIDSSTIASIMYHKLKCVDINTFSAVYKKGGKGDESEFISEYKSTFKNMHYAFPTGESLFNDQMSLIKAQAEPFPTTAIYAQYQVMKLAKGKVKVLLDGQGADEQLAGYHYFFGYYFKELLHQLKLIRFLLETYSYLVKHRSSYGLKVFLSLYLPDSIFVQQKTKHSGISSDFSSQFDIFSASLDSLIKSKNLNSSLVNHFNHKLEHLLKWEDRNSMWFSIESRIPFLDYRLVEATLSQPSKKLIRNGETKSLLRDSVSGIVPEKIRKRKDKIGFQTPEDQWFKSKNYKSFILDVINSESFKSRKLIDYRKANKLYDYHLNNKINISKEIWKWINLELWFKNYIDN